MLTYLQVATCSVIEANFHSEQILTKSRRHSSSLQSGSDVSSRFDWKWRTGKWRNNSALFVRIILI